MSHLAWNEGNRLVRFQQSRLIWRKGHNLGTSRVLWATYKAQRPLIIPLTGEAVTRASAKRISLVRLQRESLGQSTGAWPSRLKAQGCEPWEEGSNLSHLIWCAFDTAAIERVGGDVSRIAAMCHFRPKVGPQAFNLLTRGRYPQVVLAQWSAVQDLTLGVRMFATFFKNLGVSLLGGALVAAISVFANPETYQALGVYAAVGVALGAVIATALGKVYDKLVNKQ